MNIRKLNLYIFAVLISFQIHSAEYKKLICDQAWSKEVFESRDQYLGDLLNNPAMDILHDHAKEWFSKGKKQCEASKVWRSIILIIDVENIDKPYKTKVEKHNQNCWDVGPNTPNEVFMKSTPTSLIFCKYDDCRYGLTVNRETLIAIDSDSTKDPYKTCRIEDMKSKNKI